jgi:hypothetical protein
MPATQTIEFRAAAGLTLTVELFAIFAWRHHLSFPPQRRQLGLWVKSHETPITSTFAPQLTRGKG